MLRGLAIFLATIAVGPAVAQPRADATVEAVEIAEYGLYAADTVNRVTDPGAPIGFYTTVTNVRLIEKTDIICAKLHQTFGVRFVAIGGPANARVELEWVTRFPPAGVTNAAGKHFTESRLLWPAIIGAMDYRTFTFDEEQEIVPGPWKLEFYHRGRKVGEKAFEVKPGCSGIS